MCLWLWGFLELVCLLGAFVSVLRALAFPCIVSGLLALPLCGAAPTSLCRLQREVGKRKQLKPLLLSGYRGLLRVVVHLESGFVHPQASVTRVSYFRRRCARRRVLLNTARCVFAFPPHSARWLGGYRLNRSRQFGGLFEVRNSNLCSLDLAISRRPRNNSSNIPGSLAFCVSPRRSRWTPLRKTKPLVSPADPSATHVVRSGS